MLKAKTPPQEPQRTISGHELLNAKAECRSGEECRYLPELRCLNRHSVQEYLSVLSRYECRQRGGCAVLTGGCLLSHTKDDYERAEANLLNVEMIELDERQTLRNLVEATLDNLKLNTARLCKDHCQRAQSCQALSRFCKFQHSIHELACNLYNTTHQARNTFNKIYGTLEFARIVGSNRQDQILIFRPLDGKISYFKFIATVLDPPAKDHYESVLRPKNYRPSQYVYEAVLQRKDINMRLPEVRITRFVAKKSASNAILTPTILQNSCREAILFQSYENDAQQQVPIYFKGEYYLNKQAQGQLRPDPLENVVVPQQAPTKYILHDKQTSFNRAFHGSTVIFKVVKESNDQPPKKFSQVVRILDCPVKGRKLYGIVQTMPQQAIEEKVFFSDEFEPNQQRNARIYYFRSYDANLPPMEIVKVQKQARKQLPKENYYNALKYFFVEVEIVAWIETCRFAYCSVTAVIGRLNNPQPIIDFIIDKYEIERKDFSDELKKQVLDQLSAQEAKVAPQSNEIIFSIDDASTFAIDDALSVEILPTPAQSGPNTPKAYRVGIHIAAASQHIVEGSDMDIEAKRRSQSTYVGKFFFRSMIPSELIASSSIAEGQVRQVLSLYVDVDEAGVADLQTYTFKLQPIVCSARLTYTEVVKIMNEKVDSPSLSDKDKLVKNSLHILNQLAARIKFRRVKLGRADQYLLSEDERATEESQRLVESFMVLGNQLTTKFVEDELRRVRNALQLPQLYDNEEAPILQDELTVVEKARELVKAKQSFDWLDREILSKLGKKLDCSSVETLSNCRREIVEDDNVSQLIKKYVDFLFKINNRLLQLIVQDNQIQKLQNLLQPAVEEEEEQVEEEKQNTLSLEISEIQKPAEQEKVATSKEVAEIDALTKEVQQMQLTSPILQKESSAISEAEFAQLLSPEKGTLTLMKRFSSQGLVTVNSNETDKVQQEIVEILEQTQCDFDLSVSQYDQQKMDELIIDFFGRKNFEQYKFTSPIRRYPDLLVHRIVILLLQRRQEINQQQEQQDIEKQKTLDMEIVKRIKDYREYAKQVRTKSQMQWGKAEREIQKYVNCRELYQRPRAQLALVKKISYSKTNCCAYVQVFLNDYEIEEEFELKEKEFTEFTYDEKQKCLHLTEKQRPGMTQQQLQRFILRELQGVRVLVHSNKHFPLDYHVVWDSPEDFVEAQIPMRVIDISQDEHQQKRVLTIEAQIGSKTVSDTLSYSEEQRAMVEGVKVGDTIIATVRQKISFPSTYEFFLSRKE